MKTLAPNESFPFFPPLSSVEFTQGEENIMFKNRIRSDRLQEVTTNTMGRGKKSPKKITDSGDHFLARARLINSIM